MRLPTIAGLAAIACACAPVRLCAQFRLERVAPNVYATIRTEPPGQAFESNSVFIIGDTGVVVIDAQSNLSATREVLAALRQITRKRVTTLILTHWHFDHVTGAQVYRDSFPDVRIVAHARTKEAFDTGATGRRRFIESLPQVKAYFQGMLAEGKSFDGEPLSSGERASIESDIRFADRYATTPADFTPAAPTDLVTDHLSLRLGRRRIELIYPGRGHTAGDLVVHLPDDGVLITGDLVTSPVPLIGTTSFPHDFAKSLDRLVALKPRVIVQGHGPVLRGDAYLRQSDELLHHIADQADSAVARGDSLAGYVTAAGLRAWRVRFVGEDKVGRILFSSYVVQPGTQRAFEEAGSARR